MRDRSLPGLAILLLAASCVPPSATGSVPTAARADRPRLPARGQAPGPLLPTALLAPETTALEFLPPFVDAARSDEDERRSLDCLTAAIYYEARSEPLDGQRAVAQVVLNRVRSPAFPDSVCGVVYQGAERTTGCQFSFTCDGSLLYRREPEAWERAQEVARAALAGGIFPAIGLATYYHTTAILPWWAPSLDRVATIGAHIFYSWRAGLGGAASFNQRYSGIEPDSATAAADAAVSPLQAPVIVALANGQTIAIHRGDAFQPMAPGPEAVAEAAVMVHRGSVATGAATEPDGAADAAVAGVTVHRAEAAAETITG